MAEGIPDFLRNSKFRFTDTYPSIFAQTSLSQYRTNEIFRDAILRWKGEKKRSKLRSFFSFGFTEYISKPIPRRKLIFESEEKKNGQWLRKDISVYYRFIHIQIESSASQSNPPLINNHRVVDRRKAEFYEQQAKTGGGWGENREGDGATTKRYRINHESRAVFSRTVASHISFDNRRVWKKRREKKKAKEKKTRNKRIVGRAIKEKLDKPDFAIVGMVSRAVFPSFWRLCLIRNFYGRAGS